MVITLTHRMAIAGTGFSFTVNLRVQVATMGRGGSRKSLIT